MRKVVRVKCGFQRTAGAGMLAVIDDKAMKVIVGRGTDGLIAPPGFVRWIWGWRLYLARRTEVRETSQDALEAKSCEPSRASNATPYAAPE